MKSFCLAIVLVLPTLAFAAVPTDSIDIGSVGAAGSTSTTNGVYTVRGSGTDIWGTQDEFRFVHGALNGDGEITARVDSLAAINPWTKAGVMIRESLSAGSRYAYTIVSGSHGVSYQYRSATAGSAAQSGTADEVTRAPQWVRVRRAGNVFSAYVSGDGKTWRQQGSSVTIAMSANVYAGLAVTSEAYGALATATFSNVDIATGGSTPTTPPPATPPPATPPPATPPPATPPPTGPAPQLTSSADIGNVGAGGSTSTANGVYTVNGSGDDIWGSQDEFRFVYSALNGDGEITARVNSLTALDEWTKAGVMIRESLSGSSRFAFAMVTGDRGVSFQYRSSTGGSAAQSGTQDGVTSAPYWVRLRRVGNVFTAFVSADGQSWRQQGGNVTIAMGSSVYAGLAVTSHFDGYLATAAFSNVDVAAVGGTPVPTNTPPSISGTPPTTATAGVAYSFQPSATDADDDTLTYSIANRPSWATFSATTGRLSGTPTSANVGSFGGIVIGVSDGEASATLQAFTIVVSTTGGGNGNGSNRAPVISGTPLTSVVVGAAYSFQPTASDPDGDPLTFSITNRPSWATFNATSGRLQGTPTAANVGTYNNIQIRVSDDDATTSLAAFNITVLAFASGSATLTWQPPTQNTDGSPLTNLAGYRVYWGLAAADLASSVTLNNAGLTSYVVQNLAPGMYFFAVSALNSLGVESELSNTASKAIQ
jgi:hypothetical protein